MLNKNQVTEIPYDIVQNMVAISLSEDVGYQDITAQLVKDIDTNAFCITREEMILCGTSLANEVVRQLDDNIQVKWFYSDGDLVSATKRIFELKGNARNILTAERAMLNFIQTLSATATSTYKMSNLIVDYKTKLLDTRKTIPGLRIAQKYAVKCGGAFNHRIGLYDGYLIKENHIRSAGSIAKAVSKANELHSDKFVEVEVTSINELQQAIQAKADIVMLDNFTLNDINKAVIMSKDKLLLEVSGNINSETIVEIAKTGVDFISVGGITKHIQAIDLSMQIEI
jgi:nicotinate-nucleotide pyrophosphorylase (carboxylating)